MLFVVFGSTGAVYAQKYLTGEISGSYIEGEYIVSGNVHVLPKTKLIFEPGCVLRFENYTGIVVRGELVCKGTALKPIIFTSSRDIPNSHTMPEAFDWNGIKVTSEATGITLENCLIAYSTFGLNIESNATPVSIKEIKFNNNGSASLTREKKMMPVTDNLGISFVWPEMISQPEVQEPSDSSSGKTEPMVNTPSHNDKKVTKKEMAKPRPNWKPTMRITTGSIAAVGGVVWIFGYLQSVKYQNQRNQYIPLSSDFNTADNNYKNWTTIQNIGIGVFCAGAIGFSVTFLF